jgi:uncharacterized membrane protein
MESSKRSLFKTATWYVSHIVMATSVAFLITHDFRVAATIASAEIVWEAALFFGHERAWAKFGNKVK